MSGINDLNVIACESVVKWKYKEKIFSMSFSKIDQVMVDERRELIFVLDQKKELPQRLSIISGGGEVLSTSPPPDGGQFYYMTIDTQKEVLVVCIFSKKIDGWSDWHFSFNQKDNLLLRVSPAY
ncbi:MULTISPECIES: hypothetical protein [unclassified Pantoea]|uniref:hypothetical protein n=1 Tax=unclassified Pantoea TaxID=2630326 RepID=UPI0024775336|nr:MULTISPECIES: hypothetical protein [unclassified Pantoea]GME44405.1 hypothetical protein ACJ1_35220 [Pantoea sp. QMID1]GME44428.1 hypothetical protein ACJ3_35430 [Pantoea sp. QMID3]GME58990.1 hypothetical protein ACJ4_31740 [Pantoea sp. QMID4]GME60421.1 hypothetical protein ACJ2_31820 [Pantoea sp. QMID2]